MLCYTGYSIAGMKNGVECYCMSSYDIAMEAYFGFCGTKCPGDASQTCGGSDSFNVYDRKLLGEWHFIVFKSPRECLCTDCPHTKKLVYVYIDA